MSFFDSIKNISNLFFDLVFGWSNDIHPAFGIAFVAFVLTFLSTLAYKFLTDQEALKKIKEDHKSLRNEIEKHKDSPARVAELQKQLLQKSFMEPMSHQIKPLLVTFIPFLLVFGWMSKVYKDVDINFLFIHNWFWLYLITAILLNSLLRKLLKVH